MSRHTLPPEVLWLNACCARAVGLCSPPTSVPGEIDWPRFLDLATEHDLSPLLGSRLVDRTGRPPDWVSTIPEQVAHDLRQAYRWAAIEAAAHHVLLRRTMKSLEGRCTPVLLKGAALRLTSYETAAERLMSDVDLLVPRGAVEPAREALAAGGYSPCGEPRQGHHHGPPMVSFLTGLAFELHTNLSTPPLSEGFMALARQHVIEAPGGDLVFDPPMGLVHHAHHAVSDLVDSPLLRNLLEVGFLAEALQPGEVNTFTGLVKAAGIELQVSRALSLAHYLFGTRLLLPRVPPGPFEDWALRRLQWIGPRELTSPLARFERNVADDHTSALLAKPAKSPQVVWLRLADRSLRTKITAGFRRLRNRLEPAAADVEPVGAGLLIHELDSGHVHWLDSTASAAWQAARGGCRAKAVVTRLSAEGVSRRTSRLTIERLVQCGLLRRV